MENVPGLVSGLIAFLLCTSFVKIFSALTIFRYGLGLRGGGFGVVIAAISLALSLLVMSPMIERAGGVDAVLVKGSVGRLEGEFRPFLVKNTDPELLAKMQAVERRLHPNAGSVAPDSSSMGVSLSAFLLSELSKAFLVGLIIIIPFVVVDLVVTNVLAAIGVTQMSHEVIAVPLKLLLFVAVNGWGLIAEKLVGGYV